MVFVATAFRFLLAVSATVTFIVNSSPVFEPRNNLQIVGGRDADIRDYPYQVSVQYFGSHMCGGSIISLRHVLTAAHCTDSLSALSVVYGITNRSDGNGTRGKVLKVYQHPKFNWSNLQYDVSVLRLATEIVLSNTAAIIKLATTEPNLEPISFNITGWGSLREGGSGSDHLKVVEINLVPRSTCAKLYKNSSILIHESMICAGVPLGGKDACQGDSGGPMVWRVNGEFRQAGIVSWGKGCARPNYPGVYSNVATLRGFITAKMIL